MVQVLIFILALFLSYKIFINKGNYISLLWVIVPSLLLNSYIVVTKIPMDMPIMRWLIFSLLFTEVWNTQTFRKNWHIFPLKWGMLSLIIGSLLIGLLDSRLSVFQKFYAPFREVTDTYLILFLGYVAIKNRNDLYRMRMPVLYAILLVALYGVFNFVTKTNPYYSFVIENYYQGGEIDFASRMRVLDVTLDRFRAVSTFNMTFNYGYISSLIALFFLFLSTVFQKKTKYYFGFAAGIVGTILCFSRTVFLAALIGFGVYILLSYKTTSLIKTLIALSFIVVISYSFIPVFQKTVDNTLGIFMTGGENVSGSSIEMRYLQFSTAYKYFNQSPVRGNGYGFIRKELGWGDRDNAILDKDMYGFESIIYQVMIEQGLIGLVTKLLLFISFFVFFIKNWNNKKNRKLAGLGIAITLLFLTFSIGTGPLGAWPITMLFLGVIIKTIQLNAIKTIK